MEFVQLWKEFEAMKTAEARFARTIDSMQPLLLAYLNGGRSWKIHNIIRSQVIATKKHMEHGSIILWNYAQELLEDATEKGILKDQRQDK